MNRHPTGEVLVVTHDASLYRSVAQSLKGRVRLRPCHVTWDQVVADEVTESTRAVIMFNDPPSGRPSATTRTLRGMLADRIPLCVLALNEPTQKGVRAFYKAGAALVTAWPAERDDFPRHLSELLSLRLVRGKADEPSRALARATKARLKAHHPSLASLSVSCRAGHLEVSGEVDALWRKRQVHNLVAHTPGIVSADLSELVVRPPRVSRAKLIKAVSDIVAATTSHPKSVAVSARNQIVSLAGTVDDAEEVRRIEQLVTNVRGVRELRNLLVVDRAMGERDDRVARALLKRLQTRWPDAGWSVDVVGGRGIVEGRVSLLDEKLAALALVEDAAPGGVVDKIEVRPK